MRHAKDKDGIVHLFDCWNRISLCGKLASKTEADMLGYTATETFLTECAEEVTCPDCARLYCWIKNAPWNEVNKDILYAASLKTENEETTSQRPTPKGCGLEVKEA